VGKILALMFFLIILFGLQESCVKTKPIFVKDIIIPTNVGPPIKFPTTYYVDSNFTQHEFNVIKSGIDEWEEKTKGIVKINLKRFIPPTPYIPKIYTKYYIKTIWKLNKKDPIIIDMFKKRKDVGFSGLSYGNSILVVMDYAETDDRLKAIMIHEIGHQISMKHIQNKYPAIMNSNLGFLELTKWDMIQFCNNYKCEK